MHRKLKIAGLTALALSLLCLISPWPFARNASPSKAPPPEARAAPLRDQVAGETGAPTSPGNLKLSSARSLPLSHGDRLLDPAVAKQATVRREIDSRLDMLSRLLDNEMRDGAWAERAESVLVDIAGSPDLPQTRVLRALCKRSLCMAEYATGSSEEYHRLAELADIGGSEGYFVEVQSAEGDDAKHLLVYLARAGKSLPAMR